MRIQTLSFPSKKLILLSIFSISMAFMESAVAIYLRKLYYPSADIFPIRAMDFNIVCIEILREGATLIMLICAGIFCGRTRFLSIAYSIFAFGIWDIFYYVFLKILISWPESFLSWDILFLIPVTWIGPVITPVLVSFFLITLSCFMILMDANRYRTEFTPTEKTLLITGTVLILYSYTFDMTKIIVENGYLSDLLRLWKNKDFMNKISTFIPDQFSWKIFSSGFVMYLLMLLIYIFRRKKTC